ncbi:DUF305 domain-containing protein [Rhizobium calliandrae]|uniref:DUF305 domain-containing protein n=1 Tax=Rhizobium calliandrae TaxID=1312182 RepID=A0ABT7KBR6_9HYPH|nr:DUF305 domain-containing protein [Rhizobium calliandrae]MDL2406060.1 DUF305 domain-containing protein [Rhizobium calliandrae]
MSKSRSIRHLAVISALTAAALSSAALAFAQDVPASQALPSPAIQAEAPYLSENDRAMTKMMNDMAVKPSGNVDRDFVEMMIPHHQGAIDMAQAYLRYGTNEQLKRIAQEIIVDQQQEIAAMRLALGDPLPPSTAAPTVPNTPPISSGQNSSSMPSGMSMTDMKMRN